MKEYEGQRKLEYLQESPGTDGEVVRACDEKGGAVRREEGYGNRSTEEKE